MVVKGLVGNLLCGLINFPVKNEKIIVFFHTRNSPEKHTLGLLDNNNSSSSKPSSRNDNKLSSDDFFFARVRVDIAACERRRAAFQERNENLEKDIALLRGDKVTATRLMQELLSNNQALRKLENEITIRQKCLDDIDLYKNEIEGRQSLTDMNRQMAAFREPLQSIALEKTVLTHNIDEIGRLIEEARTANIELAEGAGAMAGMGAGVVAGTRSGDEYEVEEALEQDRKSVV